MTQNQCQELVTTLERHPGGPNMYVAAYFAATA